MARRAADDRFHFGLGRLEVLSGFANGVCLAFVALHIIKESFERLLEPPEARLLPIDRMRFFALGRPAPRVKGRRGGESAERARVCRRREERSGQSDPGGDPNDLKMTSNLSDRQHQSASTPRPLRALSLPPPTLYFLCRPLYGCCSQVSTSRLMLVSLGGLVVNILGLTGALFAQHLTPVTPLLCSQDRHVSVKSIRNLYIFMF